MAAPFLVSGAGAGQWRGSEGSDSDSGRSSSGERTPPQQQQGGPGRTRKTSYFGRCSPGSAKASLASCPAGPPSPATIKRLLRIRKMSDVASGQAGNVLTIPTQLADINPAWVGILINQQRVKDCLPPLPRTAGLAGLTVTDCKASLGDMSTTFKISARVAEEDGEQSYHFIAKLLPADDPCRVYVFEANVFEKEISIYFELLPALKQWCRAGQLERYLATHIPRCIYGSNNMDGAGVLVFECALQQGYTHPRDPEGLSLQQVTCVLEFMARFHAIGSALISARLKQIQLRHPYLLSNVYSSPAMVAGAQKMFEIYAAFLGAVPGQADTRDKFLRHCLGGDGVEEMFRCLRRQVDTPFNTIIHGELWEKNMLFRQTEVDTAPQCLVLDWKNAKIASATKDVAFLLLSSTTNRLRTECLMEILQHYHATFLSTLASLDPDLARDPGLTFGSFYQDYTVSTKGAFMQSVCVLVQEMQHLEGRLGAAGDTETDIGETLSVYERRALNLMNDRVLNQTHFVAKAN